IRRTALDDLHAMLVGTRYQADLLAALRGYRGDATSALLGHLAGAVDLESLDGTNFQSRDSPDESRAAIATRLRDIAFGARPRGKGCIVFIEHFDVGKWYRTCVL